jgi:hypothetical protein
MTPTLVRPTSRVLTSKEAIQAARQIAASRENINQWPYPWLFPEQDAKRVFTVGVDSTLAAATQEQVVSYQVPVGLQFAWTELCFIVMPDTAAQSYVPGDATFAADIDKPIGGALQGYPLQGFGSITIPLGSRVIPWYLTQPEILQAGQVARIKVTNTALPGGSVVVGIIGGWNWPAVHQG